MVEWSVRGVWDVLYATHQERYARRRLSRVYNKRGRAIIVHRLDPRNRIRELIGKVPAISGNTR